MCNVKRATDFSPSVSWLRTSTDYDGNSQPHPGELQFAVPAHHGFPNVDAINPSNVDANRS